MRVVRTPTFARSMFSDEELTGWPWGIRWTPKGGGKRKKEKVVAPRVAVAVVRVGGENLLAKGVK